MPQTINRLFSDKMKMTKKYLLIGKRGKEVLGYLRKSGVHVRLDYTGKIKSARQSTNGYSTENNGGRVHLPERSFLAEKIEEARRPEMRIPKNVKDIVIMDGTMNVLMFYQLYHITPPENLTNAVNSANYKRIFLREPIQGFSLEQNDERKRLAKEASIILRKTVKDYGYALTVIKDGVTSKQSSRIILDEIYLT